MIQYFKSEVKKQENKIKNEVHKRVEVIMNQHQYQDGPDKDNSFDQVKGGESIQEYKLTISDYKNQEIKYQKIVQENKSFAGQLRSTK